MSLNARDGHPLDLTLELHFTLELNEQERTTVIEHLEICAHCRQRMEDLQSMETEFQQLAAPEPERPNNVIPFRSPRTPWMGLAGALAVAAVVALMVRGLGEEASLLDNPSTDQDDFRVKGGLFDFELYVDGTDGSRRAHSGDRVEPGDRLGFRVLPRIDGHLMIVGVDATLSPFLYFPQDTMGVSHPIYSQTDAVTLEQAIRLDDTLGQERIIAMLCPDSLKFDHIEEDLVELASSVEADASLPLLREGCLQQEVVVRKENVGGDL